MPLQNRVDPYGQLRAVAERGAWMGNRGILHDESRRVVAPWRLKRWITCVLDFKGRHRDVFTPHRYTELFFLDEATAYAAGHRPCAECRREAFNRFRALWIAVHARDKARIGVDEIDAVLHGERAIRGGGKKTWRARSGTLPDGTMVDIANRAHLIWRDALWPWSFEGYGARRGLPPGDAEVTVLTPSSIVRLFAAGLRPQVHDPDNRLQSTPNVPAQPRTQTRS